MRKIIQEMIKKKIKDNNGNIDSTPLDEFLVEHGTRPSKKPGRLKDFYELQEHPRWYAFIFEHKTFFCSIEVGVTLGFFVECGPYSVKLNPVLQEQLDEPEKS